MTFRVATLAAAFAVTALAAPAFAQRHTPEQVVLGAFNICWEAEEGGDLHRLAWEAGFDPAPQATRPLYYRDVGGAVIFLAADFGPGADGQPEPACRITALKPQLDTPWTPGGSPLQGGRALVDRMIANAPSLGGGYRVVAERQPHPAHRDRVRTVLISEQGARSRMIYIEEGARDYEFLYVHGARAVVHDPATPNIGVDPSGRAPMQAFVNDRWTIAFCDLNPHACVTREQQAQIDARAARARAEAPWTLPFSGIGASGGDNRSNAQRQRDSAWWDNYHRCGAGRC